MLFYTGESVMKKYIIGLIAAVLLLCGCADQNAQQSGTADLQESVISQAETIPAESESEKTETVWIQDIYDFLQKIDMNADVFADRLSVGDAVIRLIDFDNDQQEELYLGWYDRENSVIIQTVYGGAFSADILFEDQQKLQSDATAVLKIIQTESGRIFLRSESGYYALTDGSFRKIDETSPVVQRLLYMNYTYGMIASEECEWSGRVYRYIDSHEENEPAPLTECIVENRTDQPDVDKIPQGPYEWADAYADIVWSKLLDFDIQEGRSKYTDASVFTGLTAVRLVDTEDGIPNLYIEYATFDGENYRQTYTYTGEAELIQEDAAQESAAPTEEQLLDSQMTMYYLIKQARNPVEQYSIPEPQSREEAYLLAIDMIRTIYGPGKELLESRSGYPDSIHYYGLVSAVLADFNGDGEDELFCGYMSKENAWANAAYQRVFGYEDGKLILYYARESCSAGGVDPISVIMEDETGQAYLYWKNEGSGLPDYLYLTEENGFEPAEKKINDPDRYVMVSYVKYFQADRSMDPLAKTEQTIRSLQ